MIRLLCALFGHKPLHLDLLPLTMSCRCRKRLVPAEDLHLRSMFWYTPPGF